MKDPFEDFLEDALGAPDLELGHETRRRLLEAAVASDAISGDGKVVRMDRPDPAEVAGFDWLMGESPASEAVMGRLIEDPDFLEALDGQRRFIRVLRDSLRRTAAAAVAVPARHRRWVPAAVLSAAAALAMTTGILMFSRSAPEPAAAVAMADDTPAGAGAAAPGPTTATVVPLPVAAKEKNSPLADPASPASAPFAPEPASASPPALADLGGSGRSVEPDDPAIVPQLEVAMESAEGEPEPPEALLASLGETDESEGMLVADGHDALAMINGRSFSWPMDDSNAFGGSGATGPADPGDGSIPEPGGALPVMIGFMLLLLRRPRRQMEG